jgi:CelD/BcsL family acetyltransferase involved in cellulose biosynthesis
MSACEISILEDLGAIRALEREWQELSAGAVEANVFFEDWMLIPALEHLRGKERVRLVVARVSGKLAGLFPVEQRSAYKKLPLSHMRIWQHKHCFLCTPLIHREHVEPVVAAFCDWVASAPGVPRLMLWNWIAGDGPVHAAIRQEVRRRGWKSSDEGFARSVLVPGSAEARADSEAYLESVLSGGHRRDLRRLERRLAETGAFSYTTVTQEQELSGWIAEFLELEASGWKGRQKTALSCCEKDRAFFDRCVREAFRRGKLTTLEARLEGKPIASRCNFASGGEAFSFKIAFDEKHSKSRPGLLLEVEHVRRAFASSLARVDYCADPGHPMLDRMSTARKPITTIAMASRLLIEGLILRLVPHAENIRIRLARLRKGAPEPSRKPDAHAPEAPSKSA